MAASRALQPGYVLHHRPYRETSLLLEVLTREVGRIGVVARGARGARPRWGARPVPFAPLLLGWSGRADLVTLIALEPAGPAWSLGGAALISGFYLNELLMRLLERRDPHPGLFDAYHESLARLAVAGALESSLRLFEKRLLDEIGYGLELAREPASGLTIQPGVRYRYVPGHGPVRAVAGAAPPGVEVDGVTLIGLREGRLAGRAQLREAKHLLRASLGEQLGPRPLASRELLVRLQRCTTGGGGAGG